MSLKSGLLRMAGYCQSELIDMVNWNSRFVIGRTRPIFYSTVDIFDNVI